MIDFEDPEIVLEVQEHLASVLAQHQRLFETIQDPKLQSQAAYHLLRLSGSVRIDHLIRELPPAITKNLTLQFDKQVMQSFISITSTGRLSEREELQVHLPIRENGFGLINRTRIAPVAHLAHVVEMARHVRVASLPFKVPVPLPFGMSDCLYRLYELAGAYPTPKTSRHHPVKIQLVCSIRRSICDVLRTSLEISARALSFQVV